MNPQEVFAKDPIAKKMLAQFNGVSKAYQIIKEDEARAILEYFRTLN
tara:strand:- start:3782 stop:3922 length:141 start_codon:yes stop_codon:yes gene_type:complete